MSIQTESAEVDGEYAEGFIEGRASWGSRVPNGKKGSEFVVTLNAAVMLMRPTPAGQKRCRASAGHRSIVYSQ